MDLKYLPQVGQDQSIQDPQQAIEQMTGVYKDSATMTAESDKLPTAQLPVGPDPMPFANLRTATGAR